MRAEKTVAAFDEWLQSPQTAQDVIEATGETRMGLPELQASRCLRGEHEPEEVVSNPLQNIYGLNCSKCGTLGQYHELHAQLTHKFTIYRRVGEALVCKHCRCLYVER